jgi:hypothetical protein
MQRRFSRELFRVVFQFYDPGYADWVDVRLLRQGSGREKA